MQPQMPSSASALAQMIDHTLLKPEATQAELSQLCQEAVEYGFRTVCVNSVHLPFVKAKLEGSAVWPIAVVGFPLGAASTAAKAFETAEAVRQGAEEIDTVLNLGWLKDRAHARVLADIQAVVEAAQGRSVKVILETAKLSEEEKWMASALAKAAGAAFVKTSTGFGGGGASVEDVRLMRKAVGSDMGVKASGGVRSLDDAMKLIEAGANRIGASSSVAIVSAWPEPANEGEAS